MPRGRGGSRQGKPGTSYGNRSDLNTSKIAEYTGQQYGMRAQQEASQRAVPVQAAPGAPAPQTPQAPQAPPAAPGSFGDLLSGTARPNEPLSAGMPFGPGPNGTNAPSGDPDLDNLRAIYKAHPSPDLRELIEVMGG